MHEPAMFFLLPYLGLCAIVLAQGNTTWPTVRSKAGIFHGRHLAEFDQDVFLGIKYAAKPVRFAPAELIKETPSKEFNVTQYGIDCRGYGSDSTLLVKEGWTQMGEDCLHLNIVRPRIKEENKKLPVLLWVYGGGWQQGATSDPRLVVGQG